MRNALFDIKDIPKELRKYFNEVFVECGEPWERVVGCKCPGLDGDHPGSDCADASNWPTKPCTVLDTFFGSGTTGIVAHKHGRNFIGIDLSESYLKDIAVPRIEKATGQRKLF